MPEGHSIRIYADEQNAQLAGRRVCSSSPQGRFEDAGLVDGRKLKRVEGAGKHLFYHFSVGIVHVHLGRLGRWRLHDAPPPAPRAGTRWRLETNTVTADLSGPIHCRVIDRAMHRAILDGLGCDPLRDDNDLDWLYERVSGSRKAIGGLLLDQGLFAGVGNIFRAETLFRCRVHPETPGSALGRKRFDAIWDDLVLLFERGVKHRWIIGTEAKDIGKPLAKAGRGDRFYVYRRKTCRLCGSAIVKRKVGGRPMYWCPKHQRAER